MNVIANRFDIFCITRSLEQNTSFLLENIKVLLDPFFFFR